MNTTNRAYLYMHIAVLLWSLTAILGKLISLSEFVLVWYRMIITSIFLFFVPGVIKSLRKYSFKELRPLLGIGVVVSIHWVAFYGSIKYTNASVAVACLGTSSLFAAILEPLILKTKFRRPDIFLGIGMMFAIFLITNATPDGYAFGIGLGILSSFLASLFSILNKSYAHKFPAPLFTMTEMFGGWLFLCIVLPFYLHFMPGFFHWPSTQDWIYLGLLSFFCTVLPFSLSVIALRNISAFTSVFLVNLEPLYTILLAIVLFKEHEQLSLNFYLGAAMILLCVIIHARMVKSGKFN